MSGSHLEITTLYRLEKQVDAIPVPTGFKPPIVRAREGAYDAECAEVRQRVWAVKSKLDAYPEKVYYATRDEIFSLAHSGGTVKFKNRAAHKLNESMEATGVWSQLRALGQRCSFADVCGGPGSFSQALYAGCKAHKLAMRGFGMTLMHSHLDAPQGWYPELYRKHKFVATFGIDGTGNIYRNDNVEALRSIVVGEPLRLVVADGGFELPFSIANYQEVISSRIVYGQWYAALKLLQPGGAFVLKLFDTFAPVTRSVLYLSLFAYESVHIVKPRHSRIVNSERYLVCTGFRGLTPEWIRYLDEFHKSGFGAESAADDENSSTGATTPLSIVPVDLMRADEAFMRSVSAMNTTIAEKQEEAIEFLLASKELQDNLDMFRDGTLGAKRKRDAAEGEAEQQPQQPDGEGAEAAEDGPVAPPPPGVLNA